MNRETLAIELVWKGCIVFQLESRLVVTPTLGGRDGMLLVKSGFLVVWETIISEIAGDSKASRSALDALRLSIMNSMHRHMMPTSFISIKIVQ